VCMREREIRKERRKYERSEGGTLIKSERSAVRETYMRRRFVCCVCVCVRERALTHVMGVWVE